MSKNQDLITMIENNKRARLEEAASFVPFSMDDFSPYALSRGVVFNDYTIDQLRELYVNMEMKRYEYVNQNICYGTYIISRAISTTDTNNALYDPNGGDLPDHVDGMCAGMRNTFEYIPDYLAKTGGEKGGKGLPYCARSAGLNVYVGSVVMGVPNPTAGVYTPGAGGIIEGGGDFPPLCGEKYKHLENDNNGSKLNELIKDGKIKAGDLISIYTGNSGSGYHALSVAAVNRDLHGNIISYTLMDNNGGNDKTRLITLDINDTTSENAQKLNKEVRYTSVNDCIRDEITAKANQMSRDELIEAIYASRDDLVNEIEILAVTETKLYTEQCFDPVRRTCFVRQQNDLIKHYMRNPCMYINKGASSLYNNGYILLAQQVSSEQEYENNQRLINMGVYGYNSKFDEAFAKRGDNNDGNEGASSPTKADIWRMNENNNSRA